tara:strand:- start:131 stop:508 length:378 start_codon:yes stop_codon:yes gene_type:complete
MPRTKPSKTEELRVTLGTKERMLLEDLSTSYRIQSTLPSIAAIAKDATAMYALAMIYEMVTGKDIPGVISPDDSASEIWTSIKDNVKGTGVPGGSGTLGDFWNAGTGPGSPIGDLLDFLGGGSSD